MALIIVVVTRLDCEYSVLFAVTGMKVSVLIHINVVSQTILFLGCFSYAFKYLIIWIMTLEYSIGTNIINKG